MAYLATHQTGSDRLIAGRDDLLLVTGATGFIGSKVVEELMERGFRRIRCFVRPSSDPSKVEALSANTANEAQVEVFRGNLLARQDCIAAVKDVSVIFHLAVGGGSKSFPDSYMNSVVTTRNLLEAASRSERLRRFVNISSFAVYTNRDKPRWRMLDEDCPIEKQAALRGDSYCFAKVKQDEMVTGYCRKHGIPFVIVRPGYVYGPGHEALTNRVGIDTFGVFLHLGGSNKVPLIYVDNCAQAIVMAGLQKDGVEGEVFNVIDDDLPSSRQFLRLYKKNVRRFKSFYVPHFMSYTACYLWEMYSTWSRGQLGPAFNRRKWHAYWKKTSYTNEKLKARLGWAPRVPTSEGFRRYFEACRDGGPHA